MGTQLAQGVPSPVFPPQAPTSMQPVGSPIAQPPWAAERVAAAETTVAQAKQASVQAAPWNEPAPEQPASDPANAHVVPPTCTAEDQLQQAGARESEADGGQGGEPKDKGPPKEHVERYARHSKVKLSCIEEADQDDSE